eukprot:TRINITY_DN46465_c0_g1_i1.p1 TRINITY_DN46465_c0_g1~~TRINITY_DN46465_c0_g1_i1.p1  ORF type:complete len:421 (+),score=37.26 TRINITY_DN46465_c0_g1_i1:40-1302(+)
MAPLPLTTLFVKAATAIAQAGAMASVGMIFTYAGVIDATSRKVLSTISLNVTIPCLLFSSILACDQGGHQQDPGLCPKLAVVLRSAWPMLIFPFLWVCIGVSCGLAAARLSNTPGHLRRTAIAATGFGNSTGLPIVLLTAIAEAGILDIAGTSGAQSRNFLILLSIYQITYPLIQWTVAGYLLTAKSESEDGMCSAAVEGGVAPLQENRSDGQLEACADESCCSSQRSPRLEAIRRILKAALVPPVIAVLIATFIGAIPALRNVFVDTIDFDNDRPLEWLFNAIASFGKAAVPLNMLVLGSSLASIPSFSAVHWPSTISVTFAKMVLVPSLVYALMIALHASGLTSTMVKSEDLHYQMMIVACLVSATPTANNLSIMAEASGGPACKQALAAMTFVMYCVAPFSLTAWIIAFVSLNRITG